MSYRAGTECWWIGDHNRWFRVRIVKVYGSAATYRRVVLQSVTGMDAEHQVPWPYPEGIDFAAGQKAFKRLRPLDARPLHPTRPDRPDVG